VTDEREPFSYWRERMAAHGFSPQRRFGQNFLLDPSLHRAIAAELGATRDDVVLEVGPGLGFLTRELLRDAGRVVAVEIDPRLRAILDEERASFPDRGARLEVVASDVLDGDRIAPTVVDAVRVAQAAVGGRFLLAANLPYAISGPFLAQLPVLETLPQTCVLLVQSELGERLAGATGVVDGALAALLGLTYDVRIVRRIGREVFRPRPNVDSVVIRLTALPTAFVQWSVPDRLCFRRFLRELFRSRRKQLRSTLTRAVTAALGEAPVEANAASISPALPDLSRRAEELTPSELLALFDAAVLRSRGDRRP
jgi:16S rRNA (adenine1518-N6/adenine1519-N6)-dimethyltransferase